MSEFGADGSIALYEAYAALVLARFDLNSTEESWLRLEAAEREFNSQLGKSLIAKWESDVDE